jgi:SAM-dependent methyltransferase
MPGTRFNAETLSALASSRGPRCRHIIHFIHVCPQDWSAPRVRQHVNPLKKSLQVKHGPLAWNNLYSDPLKPLVVDVGCGYGRFLLQIAKLYPQYNCLGLEIRTPAVERAQRCGPDVKRGCKIAPPSLAGPGSALRSKQCVPNRHGVWLGVLDDNCITWGTWQLCD